MAVVTRCAYAVEMMIERRDILSAGAGLTLLACAGGATAREPVRDVSFAQDFDELWRTLSERYCFFPEKRTDWSQVRSMYRPIAERAVTEDTFSSVLGAVLRELYDAHTHLSDPPVGSPRWPLYDLKMATSGGRPHVAAVSEGSAADESGIRAGDCVLAIDGVPLARRVADLTPKCLSRPDPAATLYALDTAVAGVRGGTRRMLVQSGSDAPRTLTLPPKSRTAEPDVDSYRLENGFGVITIRSFGPSEVVEAFDRALLGLRDAPGLIIDVRNNGGGDTAVARPIMGRFITTPMPYARMRRRQGRGLSAAWTEHVDPRGPFTFTGPIVVIASHWSASMAEGFPMGMRAMGRATVVGTEMMRLGAAVFSLRLDRTGVQLQYSAEPVYDVHDVPRWLMRPDVRVADSGDFMAAAVATLSKLSSRGG